MNMALDKPYSSWSGALFASTTPQLRESPGLAVDDPKILELLRAGASRLGPGCDPVSLLQEINLGLDPSDVDTLAEVREAVDQIEEMAATAGSVVAALAQLRDPENLNDDIGAGVHLLNAHVGKGQQFDWVFVPGVEDGHIPSFLAKTPAERLEELRVLLVMVSRARHGIVLSRAKTRIAKSGNPYHPRPSPWNEHLREVLSPGQAFLAQHINSLSGLVHE